MGKPISFEGRTIEVPDDATEAEVATILSSYPRQGSAVRQEDDLAEPLGGNGAYGLIGVAETGIGMAGGFLGSAAGGLRGLYSLATGEGSETAADKVRATQEFWTYQPRTKQGQAMTEVVAIPGELAARAAAPWVQRWVMWLGHKQVWR